MFCCGQTDSVFYAGRAAARACIVVARGCLPDSTCLRHANVLCLSPPSPTSLFVRRSWYRFGGEWGFRLMGLAPMSPASYRRWGCPVLFHWCVTAEVGPTISGPCRPCLRSCGAISACTPSALTAVPTGPHASPFMSSGTFPSERSVTSPMRQCRPPMCGLRHPVCPHRRLRSPALQEPSVSCPHAIL